MNAASPGRDRAVPAERLYRTPGRVSRGDRRGDAREYEAIVGAGFLLQIDAPDLGMGRHTMYKQAASRNSCGRGAARRGAEPRAAQRSGRARAHARVLGQLRRPAPSRHPDGAAAAGRDQGEAAGAAVRGRQSAARARVGRVPRPEAAGRQDPGPGRAHSTTNYIEHPQLVAERIVRFADIVGRERVIAGTDCGFGTFAASARSTRTSPT